MLLKELIDVGEFYVAYRILSIVGTGLIWLAILVLPTWFMTWVLIGLIVFLVVMVPFIVIWAAVTFFTSLRRMR